MKQTLKKWLLLSLLLMGIVITQTVNAQTYCTTTLTPNCELVCNGGFETTTGNPTGYNQLSLATGWGSLYNTPDLFSANSSTASLVNIPCNNEGYQNAHSGINYAGLLLNGFLNAGNPYGWYESMRTDLSDYLVVGKMYDVSLWVSAADLGIVENQNLLIDIGPDFTYTVSPSLLNDKNDWVLISFPYCDITGSANYIVVRSVQNFTPNSVASQTTASCGFNANKNISYIYIDDVSVKESKFSVPNVIGCLNTALTLSVTSECAVNTANYTYNWTYGDGSTSVNTGTVASASHSYTNFGTYTGSVSVSTGSCSVTYTYNVNVPVTTIAITTNTNTICNGNTSFTATPSPAGTYTSSWSLTDAATGTVIPTSSYTITNGATTTPSINFLNINQNVNVWVSMTNTLGCTATQSLYMPSCCATPTGAIKYSNKTFTTTTVLAPANLAFGGTITVNSGVVLTLSLANTQMDPNTKFIINGTGKLNLLNIYLHGCNAMWDGIYPLGTNTITIRDSRIEDAQRVLVDSLGGAVITFTNNYINKNYQGIVFKATKTSTANISIINNLFTCSSIATPTANPWVPAAAKPNLTNAPTFGAYSSVNLMAPYSTLKSYCGVYMNNASHTGKTNTAITIGGTTGQENVFDKMQFGANVYLSRSSFQNNVLQNIKSTIAPITGGANNAAVFIEGSYNGGGPYYTQVGGATTSLKNTFTNNDYGVTNIFQTGLLVEYNRFDTQTTGITVTYNNNNSTVNTSQNKFINNKIGINYDQNTLIDATISENWFDNTGAIGTYADNFAIRCTEAVLATTYSLSPKYLVYNNYINNYYNGIYTALTYQAKIRDNEIHMRPDNTAYNFQSGIQNIGSNDNEVYNNLVDYPSGTSSNWWQYNIYTAGSTVPKIHCNNTNYGGVGIIANGLNYTAAGNGFYGNSMTNHGFGFWLNAGGEIGDQYYTTTANSADNYWSSCSNETYVSSGCNNFNSGIGAKFYTRSASPYNISNPGSASSAPLLSGITAANTSMGACYGGISTPTLNLRVSGVTAQSVLMQKADEIANGTLTFAINDVSLKQIARKQLYSHLALQQIDPSITNSINAFANISKQRPIGRFFVVDSLINSGDSAKLTLANTINSAINTNIDVDVTQQQFNTQYIAFLKNQRKANAADVTAFENIAWLCPNAYGHAVYQARSVLFNITKQQYVNSCETDNSTDRRLASTPSVLETAKVKLYPNPSNGNVTFETTDDLNYNLSVYNVLGEKVFEANVTNKQTINLNNLPSATYMVLIHYSNNLIKTERMSIIH